MQDAPRDPDSIRDTVPIRPLRPWASRLLLTVAILAAAGLGWLAARMMNDMASDPSVQKRFEAVESMRRAEAAGDSSRAAASDTTGTPASADSLR